MCASALGTLSQEGYFAPIAGRTEAGEHFKSRKIKVLTKLPVQCAQREGELESSWLNNSIKVSTPNSIKVSATNSISNGPNSLGCHGDELQGRMRCNDTDDPNILPRDELRDIHAQS